MAPTQEGQRIGQVFEQPEGGNSIPLPMIGVTLPGITNYRDKQATSRRRFHAGLYRAAEPVIYLRPGQKVTIAAADIEQRPTYGKRAQTFEPVIMPHVKPVTPRLVNLPRAGFSFLPESRSIVVCTDSRHRPEMCIPALAAINRGQVVALGQDRP